MKRATKVLLIIIAVPLTLALVVLGIRFVNGLRYPAPANAVDDPKDPAQYALTQPGMTVERVEGDYLSGFHLRPDTTTQQGLVVTWGGSDGGPDYDRAVRLAGQGYEVLSLFFWGQPNQTPTLANVPLDFFDEVLAWRAEHVPHGPLTVIGTSRGAELALMLQTKYAEIDNLVVFTPTEYAWQGLDFRVEQPSWTWRGEPVPYVSFRHSDPGATAAMFGAMLLNTPIPLRAQHETAVANDPNAESARIPLVFTGNLLAFAGDDDAMWPGEIAARSWGDAAPPRTEAHIYPGAGHMFGDISGWGGGYALGGDQTANAAALQASSEVLNTRLAQWHPATNS